MHDVQNAPGPSSSCPDPTEYDHDDHILARVLPTLFIPPERLGWEYRPPTLPIPRANPEPKPILHEHEPPESDVREWLRVQRRGPQTQRVGIGGLIALVVYAIVQGGQRQRAATS